MGDGYSSMESAEEWLSEIASAELHHLQVLTLSGCNLAGSIGTSLLNSSSLSHVDLSNNDITHFPQQMFHLPNLKILDLYWNSAVTGSLPENLMAKQDLKELGFVREQNDESSEKEIEVPNGGGNALPGSQSKVLATT
ncbi:hypothetical protein Sjap_015644 [Stephania japonica]|uniref:Uncharacterized protein n=1 Tax=Stephania japonica TaxID=461633 RepID=A0AAP0IJT9_9MAGN